MRKFDFKMNFKLSPARLLVIAAALCILILVGVIVLLAPKIKANYDSIGEEEKLVLHLRTKAGALDNFASQINLVKQDDTVLRNVLPDKIDVPSFMGRVTKVATDSAVLMDSFQLVSGGGKSSNKASRSSKAVRFSLTVSGSYPEIVAYITNLENFASIVDFETLEISGAASSGEVDQPPSGLLEASFALAAYYLPITGAKPNLNSEISFNPGSDSFKEIISKAKGMVYWQADQYQNPVGKSNPFLY